MIIKLLLIFLRIQIKIIIVLLGGVNNIVHIDTHKRNITCIFLNNEPGPKTCSVVYGPSCEQLSSEQLTGQIADGNVVVIPLLENINQYCYNVTAVRGTTIVRVTGYYEGGI